jgi:hypothetical protein
MTEDVDRAGLGHAVWGTYLWPRFRDAPLVHRPPVLVKEQRLDLGILHKLHRQLCHYAIDEGVSLKNLIVGVVSKWWRSARGRRGARAR